MAASGNLNTPKRALVLRLSSLGDVVLTTSAFSVLAKQYDEVHYLTSEEYAPWLEGHPSLTKVWKYNKRAGLQGWNQIGDELGALEWDTVYDLHLSLRTRIAKKLWGLKTREWIVFQKPYLKRWGLFLLKRLWTPSMHPISYRSLFAMTVGGTGTEKTDLTHLALGLKRDPQSRFIGLMPSSRWAGKEPPIKLILEWMKREHVTQTAIVFGTKSDRQSVLLYEALKAENIPVESKIGVEQKELIRSLLQCERVAGADTGLIHVAESLGIPVHVWYGPTSPALGFAPSLTESTVSETSVMCSPCSKDGRRCYRLAQQYRCWEVRA